MKTAVNLATQIEDALLGRNDILEGFFSEEKRKLAEACREMSERFQIGGRLLAFGRGPCSTDAQHVSVEFVHPVIVGKRALPALDLSALMLPGSTPSAAPKISLWASALPREILRFGPHLIPHTVAER